MASEKRQQRVAEQIRKDLGRILLQQHADLAARLTLSEVRLTPDLAHARIFVSVMGDPAGREDGLKALLHISRDLRRELAARLRIRAVPRLRFLLDESLDRAETVERLLTQIRQEQTEAPAPEAAAPGDAAATPGGDGGTERGHP
jgi:ribosome-binding factor A